MSTVLIVIAAIIALAIVIILILAASKAEHVPPRALDRHQGAAGEDLSVRQRLPPVDVLVALGEAGCRAEAQTMAAPQAARARPMAGKARRRAPAVWRSSRRRLRRRVLIKLDFLKPFEAHNTAEFTLTPQGDGTRVDWAMYGPNVHSWPRSCTPS